MKIMFTVLNMIHFIFQFILIKAAKVSLKGTAVAMEINFHSNTCTIPGEAYMPMKRCEKKIK